jgi:hypothetical protein
VTSELEGAFGGLDAWTTVLRPGLLTKKMRKRLRERLLTLVTSLGVTPGVALEVLRGITAAEVEAAAKPRDTLERYYTDQKVADAIVQMLCREYPDRSWLTSVGCVLEPSSGQGAFIRAVQAASTAHVHAVDMDPEAPAIGDFWRGTFEELHSREKPSLPATGGYDLVIGNPPFSQAEQHARMALDLARPGGLVVFLLRLSFLGSKKRAAFRREHPLSGQWILVPRPSFTGGKTDNSEYAAMVWEKGVKPTSSRSGNINWKEEA